MLTVQIAPVFQLVGTSLSIGDMSENPPIEAGIQTLAYSKEASIVFDAEYMGITDSHYVLAFLPLNDFAVRQIWQGYALIA